MIGASLFYDLIECSFILASFYAATSTACLLLAAEHWHGPRGAAADVEHDPPCVCSAQCAPCVALHGGGGGPVFAHGRDGLRTPAVSRGSAAPQEQVSRTSFIPAGQRLVSYIS